MLYRVIGKVVDLFDNKVVVDTAGLGLEIVVPFNDRFLLNQEVTLLIYLHWSAEQGPSLFGFEQKIERDIFIAMIGCSGIGPKMAMTILASMNVFDFIQAIVQQDIKTVSSIKGLGIKKAEHLILYLKDKVGKLIDMHPVVKQNNVIAALKDVSDTLSSLRYSSSEIKQAITTLQQQGLEADISFDLLLRKALILLAKK